MDFTEKIIEKENKIFNQNDFKKFYIKRKSKGLLYLFLYIVVALVIFMSQTMMSILALALFLLIYSLRGIFFPSKKGACILFNYPNLDVLSVHKTSLFDVKKVIPSVHIDLKDDNLIITHVSGVVIYDDKADLHTNDKSFKYSKIKYSTTRGRYTSDTDEEKKKYYIFELENDNYITFLNLDDTDEYKKIQKLDNSRV